MSTPEDHPAYQKEIADFRARMPNDSSDIDWYLLDEYEAAHAAIAGEVKARRNGADHLGRAYFELDGADGMQRLYSRMRSADSRDVMQLTYNFFYKVAPLLVAEVVEVQDYLVSFERGFSIAMTSGFLSRPNHHSRWTSLERVGPQVFLRNNKLAVARSHPNFVPQFEPSPSRLSLSGKKGRQSPVNSEVYFRLRQIEKSERLLLVLRQLPMETIQIDAKF